MKIEDLCALWPPLETDSIERGFFLGDLGDIAVGADLGRDDLAEFIEPMIRARNGEEYTASLRLPENLLAPVLASIVEKFGSSLQAIGGNPPRRLKTNLHDRLVAPGRSRPVGMLTWY